MRNGSFLPQDRNQADEIPRRLAHSSCALGTPVGSGDKCGCKRARLPAPEPAAGRFSPTPRQLGPAGHCSTTCSTRWVGVIRAGAVGRGLGSLDWAGFRSALGFRPGIRREPLLGNAFLQPDGLLSDVDANQNIRSAVLRSQLYDITTTLSASHPHTKANSPPPSGKRRRCPAGIPVLKCRPL